MKRAALGAAAVVTLFSSRSLAWEGEITSDSTMQIYDVRSPTGIPVLMRTRFTSTLGVAVYDLLETPKQAGQENKPDLTFRARMRYDADYGAAVEEATQTVTDRYVPGFSRGPVDLMYAYVEGRRFLKGVLGFKVGRQYVTDALGWWSFDGGQVRVTTPAYFALEAYGGLERAMGSGRRVARRSLGHGSDAVPVVPTRRRRARVRRRARDDRRLLAPRQAHVQTRV